MHKFSTGSDLTSFKVQSNLHALEQKCTCYKGSLKLNTGNSSYKNEGNGMKINKECFTLWDDDFQPSLPVKMNEGKINKKLEENSYFIRPTVLSYWGVGKTRKLFFKSEIKNLSKSSSLIKKKKKNYFPYALPSRHLQSSTDTNMWVNTIQVNWKYRLVQDSSQKGLKSQCSSFEAYPQTEIAEKRFQRWKCWAFAYFMEVVLFPFDLQSPMELIIRDLKEKVPKRAWWINKEREDQEKKW